MQPPLPPPRLPAARLHNTSGAVNTEDVPVTPQPVLPCRAFSFRPCSWHLPCACRLSGCQPGMSCEQGPWDVCCTIRAPLEGETIVAFQQQELTARGRGCCDSIRHLSKAAPLGRCNRESCAGQPCRVQVLSQPKCPAQITCAGTLTSVLVIMVQPHRYEVFSVLSTPLPCCRAGLGGAGRAHPAALGQPLSDCRSHQAPL